MIRDRRYLAPAGLTLAAQGITEGPLWDRVSKGILSIDGEEHARLRRFVAQSFTPRTTERLRESMRSVMTELLAAAPDDGELDVVELVKWYPIAVICELLGTPRERLGEVQRLDRRHLQDLPVQRGRTTGPTSCAPSTSSTRTSTRMVEQRRAEPRDDLMTELVQAEDEGDRLTPARAADARRRGARARAPTRPATSSRRRCSTFCDHPDQWDAMPDSAADAMGVVDEVMRYSPAIFGTARSTGEDVELLGGRRPGGHAGQREHGRGEP